MGGHHGSSESVSGQPVCTAMNSALTTDTEEEMRQLKEMVRQLELQNKQLRNDQLSPVHTATKERQQSRNLSTSDEDKSSKDSSLENLSIIELNCFLEREDDETWLYDPTEHPWPCADVSETKEPATTTDKLEDISHYPNHADTPTFTRSLAPGSNALPTTVARGDGALPYLETTRSGSPAHWTASLVAPMSQVVPSFSADVHEIVKLQGENLRFSSVAPPFKSSGCTTGTKLSDLRQEKFPSHGDVATRAPLDGGARAATPPNPDSEASSESSPYGSSALNSVSRLPSKGAGRRSLPNLSRGLNGLGPRPAPAATRQQATMGSLRSRIAAPAAREAFLPNTPSRCAERVAAVNGVLAGDRPLRVAGASPCPEPVVLRGRLRGSTIHPSTSNGQELRSSPLEIRAGCHAIGTAPGFKDGPPGDSSEVGPATAIQNSGTPEKKVTELTVSTSSIATPLRSSEADDDWRGACGRRTASNASVTFFLCSVLFLNK
ncbi:unnamed protein product, partial [Ixodes pacificus]